MSHSMYKISGTEATLISSECNPETSKGSENSADLYILNGKLFWDGVDFVSSSVNAWDDIGENTEGPVSGGIIFGISDGALYSIKASGSPFSCNKLENEVDWLSVTGKIPSYTSNTTYYAHAIRAGGKLYSISCDHTGNTFSITRVTVSNEIIDGFTYIKGTSSLNLTTVDTVAFGIADGKLYAVCGTIASQVGSETGWTSVSDFYNSNAFGICSGKLYYINASGGLELGITASATQEGSITGWTKISGYNSASTYPIAICDGKLYRISHNDVTQIGTESGWTHIGGYCSEAGTTGYGICNGKLYAIEYNSVTQIGTESDWMYLSESGNIAIRGSDSGTGGGGEEPGGDDSGTTGFILNGLFLSSVKPKLGQKGLLLDNKYFLPLVEGSGGSPEYYRCASVDTSEKTWTGYKAVLNDGIYTFEDTVTTGLAYTSFTPVVGNIYSADALAKVSSLYQGIPLDGLVFYAPLSESKTTTETGELIEEYNAEYTVKNGVPCFHSTQNGYLKVNNLDEFRNAYNSGTFACSFWAFYESGGTRGAFSFVGSGSDTLNQKPLCGSSIDLRQGDDSYWNDEQFENKMVNFIINSINYNAEIIINGNKVSDVELQTPSVNSPNALFFGGIPEGWNITHDPSEAEKFTGYIGAFRVYNRKLTTDEITKIFKEFIIYGE